MDSRLVRMVVPIGKSLYQETEYSINYTSDSLICDIPNGTFSFTKDVERNKEKDYKYTGIGITNLIYDIKQSKGKTRNEYADDLAQTTQEKLLSIIYNRCKRP